MEFAADRFGTRLVVVLGHSSCGAILATLEQLERPVELRSPNLRSIVDRIRPSMEALVEAGLGLDRERLVRRAVRANIRASANHLRHGSPILERLIAEDGLVVVGAEYSLESGEVEFWTYPANGLGESKQLTSGAEVLRWEGVPSPDGKYVAHHDKKQRLWLYEFETGQDRVIDEITDSFWDAFTGLTWSPDSRYLAYAALAPNTFQQVKIYDVAGGAVHDVTCKAGADCVYFEESAFAADFTPAAKK